MRAIQSLRTDNIKPLFDYPGTKEVLQPTLAAWTLSSKLLSNTFEATELITDDFGAELAAKIGLPYGKIISIGRQFDSDPCFTSHPKLHVLSTEVEPYLHVDIDFFPWTAIPQEQLDANILVFHSNTYLWYQYDKAITALEALGLDLPTLHKSFPTSRLPLNMAVVGGSKPDALRNYARFVLELARNNNYFVDQSEDNKSVIESNLPWLENLWAANILIDELEEKVTFMVSEAEALKQQAAADSKYTHLNGLRGQPLDIKLRATAEVNSRISRGSKELFKSLQEVYPPDVDIEALVATAAESQETQV